MSAYETKQKAYKEGGGLTEPNNAPLKDPVNTFPPPITGVFRVAPWYGKIAMAVFMPVILLVLIPLGRLFNHFYYTKGSLARASKPTPLRKVEDGVWILEGAFTGIGGTIKLSMSFIRLPGGGLLAYSHVPGHEETYTEVRALGEEVKAFVIGNRFHDTFVDTWRVAFPNAEVLSPQICFEYAKKFTYPTGTCEERLPALGVTTIPMYHLTREPMKELVHQMPLPLGGTILLTGDYVSTCFVPGYIKDEKEFFCQHSSPWRTVFCTDPAKSAELLRSLVSRKPRMLIGLHGPEICGEEQLKKQLLKIAEDDEAAAAKR